MISKNYKMVRYADNIMIVAKHGDTAKQSFIDVSEFLSGVGLKLYKLGDVKSKEKHSIIGPLQDKTF